jgi:hypothetical protein
VPEQKPGETVEGRLADLIERYGARIGHGDLSKEECAIIVKCLRERARWMASDIYAGERPGSKRR